MESNLDMHSQPSIVIVVVNYQRPLSECVTIKSIQKLSLKYKKQTHLVVWDNLAISENGTFAALAADLKSYTYLPLDQNEPLSKIYNATIKSHLHDSEYCILFDNDSDFSDAFFEALDAAIERYPLIDLFLPIVRASGHIISPAPLYQNIGWYPKSVPPGLHKSLNRTAINSGMVIRSRFYNIEFKAYHPRLQFYGTDNYFMKKYASLRSEFAVFDFTMKHDLARFKNETLDRKLFRFRDYCNGVRVTNLGASKLSNLIVIFYLIISAIRHSIRYKSLSFLKVIADV